MTRIDLLEKSRRPASRVRRVPEVHHARVRHATPNERSEGSRGNEVGAFGARAHPLCRGARSERDESVRRPIFFHGRSGDTDDIRKLIGRGFALTGHMDFQKKCRNRISILTHAAQGQRSVRVLLRLLPTRSRLWREGGFRRKLQGAGRHSKQRSSRRSPRRLSTRHPVSARLARPDILRALRARHPRVTFLAPTSAPAYQRRRSQKAAAKKRTIPRTARGNDGGLEEVEETRHGRGQGRT